MRRKYRHEIDYRNINFTITWKRRYEKSSIQKTHATCKISYCDSGTVSKKENHQHNSEWMINTMRAVQQEIRLNQYKKHYF